MKCLRCTSVQVEQDRCCNCGESIPSEDLQFTDLHLYCGFCKHKEFREPSPSDVSRNFCREMLDVDSRITYVALIDWSGPYPKPVQSEKRQERLIPTGSLKMFTSLTAAMVLEMFGRVKPFTGPVRYYVVQYEKRLAIVYGTPTLFLVLILDADLDAELLQKIKQAVKDLASFP